MGFIAQAIALGVGRMVVVQPLLVTTIVFAPLGRVLEGRRIQRAGWLGTAGGILFGLAAALTKTTVSLFDDGVGAVLWDWHLYALVVVSIAAFWLEQAALQTGALAAAVATTMAFDPLSSLVFGIVLLDEVVDDSALGYLLSAVSLAVAFAGLVILARAKGSAATPPRRSATAAASAPS